MVEKLLARLKFQIELQNETQDKTNMHKNVVDLLRGCRTSGAEIITALRGAGLL